MEKDENSKQKILSAATKLFAHKGFDAVSVRKICKEANANLCLISYHFGGKQELYNAIIDDLIEKQTRYANTFLDFSVNPRTLKKPQLSRFLQMEYRQMSQVLQVLTQHKLLRASARKYFQAEVPELTSLQGIGLTRTLSINGIF